MEPCSASRARTACECGRALSRVEWVLLVGLGLRGRAAWSTVGSGRAQGDRAAQPSKGAVPHPQALGPQGRGV